MWIYLSNQIVFLLILSLFVSVFFLHQTPVSNACHLWSITIPREKWTLRTSISNFAQNLHYLECNDTFHTLTLLKESNHCWNYANCFLACSIRLCKPWYHTLSFPLSASSLPAARVAPPARKLEWWKYPFFFLMERENWS